LVTFSELYQKTTVDVFAEHSVHVYRLFLVAMAAIAPKI